MCVCVCVCVFSVVKKEKLKSNPSRRICFLLIKKRHNRGITEEKDFQNPTPIPFLWKPPTRGNWDLRDRDKHKKTKERKNLSKQKQRVSFFFFLVLSGKKKNID